MSNLEKSAESYERAAKLLKEDAELHATIYKASGCSSMDSDAWQALSRATEAYKVAAEAWQRVARAEEEKSGVKTLTKK